MRSLTPGASCPVVPWTQPREPLERRASPRGAWFYGLARLRKVRARDPESSDLTLWSLASRIGPFCAGRRSGGSGGCIHGTTDRAAVRRVVDVAGSGSESRPPTNRYPPRTATALFPGSL